LLKKKVKKKLFIEINIPDKSFLWVWGSFHGSISLITEKTKGNIDGTDILTSLSIKASTADPALTNNMTRLGFFNSDTMFSSDVAPITFVPLASFFIKSSTLDTVLLKATTYNTKPQSSIM
jgi:hypothetical protein